MTINKKRKQRIISDLKTKEGRDYFISSIIDVGVAFQIRAIRNKKEWNQTQLAEKANMKQARISELENSVHSPTLDTLKKLASAFDAGLLIKFVSLSELVEYELNLDSGSLEVTSYDEDEYFKEVPTEDIPCDFNYYEDASTQQGLSFNMSSKNNNIVILEKYLHKKGTIGKDRKNNIQSAKSRMMGNKYEGTISQIG